MNFYFPAQRALCMAENATHNLHNLLTLRGALVRDPRMLGPLPERGHRAVRRGHRRGVRLPPLADLGHATNVTRYLSEQRDLYAYLHDQTLRLLNHGSTGMEIAEDDRAAARRWRTPGTPAATTARSATTSRPSTSATWAGSTATRRSLWQHPPQAAATRYVDVHRRPAGGAGQGPGLRRRRRSAVRGRAAQARRVRRPGRHAPPASCAGRRLSSGSATERRTPPGGASTCPARWSCARVSSPRRSATWAPAWPGR